MNQWTGKKVAFLGDSITDKCHVGTTKNYWQYLEEYLGIVPMVYGINGERIRHIVSQTKELQKDHGDDVDAICVFMGTNDYNNSIPLGEWWSIREEKINSHGRIITKSRRIFLEDVNTVCGGLNSGLHYLKENFPLAQIILFTPIHRGYACFGGDNVQPEESYPNELGLYIEVYIEEYIDTIKKAGSIWSIPVIDLFEKSGLLPVNDAYTRYFHLAETDRLHPSAEGHERMARTMMYQMLALPSTFRS